MTRPSTGACCCWHPRLRSWRKPHWTRSCRRAAAPGARAADGAAQTGLALWLRAEMLACATWVYGLRVSMYGCWATLRKVGKGGAQLWLSLRPAASVQTSVTCLQIRVSASIALCVCEYCFEVLGAALSAHIAALH